MIVVYVGQDGKQTHFRTVTVRNLRKVAHSIHNLHPAHPLSHICAVLRTELTRGTSAIRLTCSCELTVDTI